MGEKTRKTENKMGWSGNEWERRRGRPRTRWDGRGMSGREDEEDQEQDGMVGGMSGREDEEDQEQDGMVGE